LVVFSSGVLDLKNGALIQRFGFSIQAGKTKEKVDWPLKCFPIKIGVNFSKDLVINSGRYLDIGCEEKQISRVNQLSGSKVYPQAYVNKRINALFNVFGNYGAVRIIYNFVS